ncbi:MAG: hypothetical protein PQJ46_03255, partial [Spirochaetales bacterium]|nr:hypothetical protein [Spirochaetales bacterium]
MISMHRLRFFIPFFIAFLIFDIILNFTNSVRYSYRNYYLSIDFVTFLFFLLTIPLVFFKKLNTIEDLTLRDFLVQHLCGLIVILWGASNATFHYFSSGGVSSLVITTIFSGSFFLINSFTYALFILFGIIFLHLCVLPFESLNPVKLSIPNILSIQLSAIVGVLLDSFHRNSI